MTLSKVDPTDINNYAVRYAIVSRKLETANELLKDPKVDPSDDDNWALKHMIRLYMTYGSDFYREIEFILKDKRVRDNLTTFQIEQLKEMKLL